MATGWNSNSEESASEETEATNTATPIAKTSAADSGTATAAGGAEPAGLESAENRQPENMEPATTVPPVVETTKAQSNATANSAASSEGTEDEAAALIAQANAALEKKQYAEALMTLQKVPKDQRDSKFSNLLIKARVGASEAEQINTALLTDALTAIQPAQASQFTEAIAKARRIQPGEPVYDEAQQNIKSWSQTILDIAEGRAATGSLEKRDRRRSSHAQRQRGSLPKSPEQNRLLAAASTKQSHHSNGQNHT